MYVFTFKNVSKKKIISMFKCKREDKIYVSHLHQSNIVHKIFDEENLKNILFLLVYNISNIYKSKTLCFKAMELSEVLCVPAHIYNSKKDNFFKSSVVY